MRLVPKGKILLGVPVPSSRLSIDINAPAQSTFDLIHEYDKRPLWDSMLCEARLLNGATVAAQGVRSRCVGSWKCLWIPIEAIYVSFKSGKVAAVKMVNRPLFFAEFAATIRHDALDSQSSTVTYIYNFKSKPRWLAPVFEPVMNAVLAREVRHRLRALKSYAESLVADGR